MYCVQDGSHGIPFQAGQVSGFAASEGDPKTQEQLLRGIDFDWQIGIVEPVTVLKSICVFVRLRKWAWVWQVPGTSALVHRRSRSALSRLYLE
jgi:hypothetical protein